MPEHFPSLEKDAAAMPCQVVDACLNGAFNHEVKTAAIITFFSNYDSEQNALSVARAMRKAQGEQLAWEVVIDDIRQFCELSLEPIAHIIEGSKEGGWRVAPEHHLGKLALAGGVSDWSLRYPDISLQEVYGKTSSRSAGRSPELRRRMYELVLTTAEAPSRKTIADALPEAMQHRVRAQIDQLVQAGIFNKSTVADHNPAIKIKRSEFVHSSVAFEQLTPETKALYNALGRLGVGTVVRLNALVDAALDADSTIDDVLLRSKIQGYIATDGFPSLQLVENAARSRDHRTAITFDETAFGPVKDLCRTIDNIQDGIDVKPYAARAIEIFRSEEEFRALIAKGRAFSANVNSQEQAATTKQIIAILQSRGSCTLTELRAAMANRVRLQRVRDVLTTLVESGTVAKELIARGPHAKVSKHAYHLNKMLDKEVHS